MKILKRKCNFCSRFVLSSTLEDKERNTLNWQRNNFVIEALHIRLLIRPFGEVI